jgi:hypothetical protein
MDVPRIAGGRPPGFAPEQRARTLGEIVTRNEVAYEMFLNPTIVRFRKPRTRSWARH